MSISAYNIGTKFNADGSVRFFPGNTIISKIDHNAPVFEEFKKIPDKVVEMTFTKEEYSNPYSAVCMMNQIIVRDCLNMAALMRDGKSYLVKLY